VASLESIKHLGTNGGGFFSMNAAHPFENPTPLTNLLHILSMLLIPAGMTYAFGSMLLRRKQGWVLFAACMVMFVGFLSLVFVAEQNGSQLLARAGADQQYSLTQSGGNMEGKELRFGIADTALFVATTTAATTGSVNAMHDSLTPLGGITPLAQMMLNCVFGGDGVGLINLIQYAILTVFLAGMMIGRTPNSWARRSRCARSSWSCSRCWCRRPAFWASRRWPRSGPMPRPASTTAARMASRRFSTPMPRPRPTTARPLQG
jgi:K+-transporting ATPase ATPase A chain